VEVGIGWYWIESGGLGDYSGRGLDGDYVIEAILKMSNG
jgi:hypothetical protein